MMDWPHCLAICSETTHQSLECRTAEALTRGQQARERMGLVPTASSKAHLQWCDDLASKSPLPVTFLGTGLERDTQDPILSKLYALFLFKAPSSLHPSSFPFLLVMLASSAMWSISSTFKKISPKVTTGDSLSNRFLFGMHHQYPVCWPVASSSLLECLDIDCSWSF